MMSASPSIERVFLGWDKPALSQAAEWLQQHHGQDGLNWDLSRCVLVVPGARASRRLLEILVANAEARPLVPPQIITLGDLPEHLYGPDLGMAVAGDVPCILARVHALRQADRALVQRIAPHPPTDDDFTGWLALAQELHALASTLAAELLHIADVAPKLAVMPDFGDEDRWAALTQLQRDYEQVLADRGWQDQNGARFAAIADHRCATDKHIVLIATADLNRTVRAMLEQVADRVTALVHAPACEAEAFDAFGALEVDQWFMRGLDLPDEMIRVVDQPRDQACEVLRAMSKVGGGGDAARSYAADQITIGLGDEALGPTVQRTLALAGVPVHSAAGRAAAVAPPVLLLHAVARFAGALRRFDDFAALLRHHDLETYLIRKLGPIDQVRHEWLTLLDEYATQTLQRRLTGAWLGDEQTRSRMKQLYTSVVELLPLDAMRKRPLPVWAKPLAQMLTTLYDRPLHRHDENDGPLVRVLELIGNSLREQAQLDGNDAVVPHVTFAQAIDWTLSRLAGQSVPVESSGASVELLGWLELELDDAPVLIVAGFNEGAIPQSRSADAFLPDGVRRMLGLADNRRRMARDRMALEAIIASRPHVVLIAGRHSVEGDPLKPSRLLLLGAPASLAHRIEMFYVQHADAPAHDQAVLLLSPGSKSGFHMPPPAVTAVAIDALRVTAFRDYIACPYRFFLKYIERLDEIGDRIYELDGRSFGILAHRVLGEFGASEFAHSENGREIAAYLSRTLDRFTEKDFGAAPPVAVMVQREQLRERLDRFALWQAGLAAAGWRIKHIERDCQAALEVDDKPFTITGRIDRIDEHGEMGYRVIDYKTADSPQSPEQSHRQGPRDGKQWIDLQLPLYRCLLAAEGIVDNVSLGYVQLPKDVSRVGYDEARWDETELMGATEYAQEIIRDIRAGIFWPPKDPPRFDDAFTAICMDKCLSRAEALAAATRIWRTQRGGGR